MLSVYNVLVALGVSTSIIAVKVRMTSMVMMLMLMLVLRLTLMSINMQMQQDKNLVCVEKGFREAAEMDWESIADKGIAGLVCLL